MLKNKKNYYWGGAVVVLSTLLFFQNCSQVAFDTNQASLTKSEAANTPIDPGSNGGEPTSSDTCEDYNLRGWASKKDCLQDGDWHLVPNPEAELETHSDAGADIKVIVPQQSLFLNGRNLGIQMSGNEECQQFYRSQLGNRPFYCLTTARFAGEAMGETGHGSARFGTDGSIYCNGMSNPGANGCVVDPMTFKWYVRY
jgi:hypothetical protein